MNLLIDSCFPSVVPLPSRGWIVPVGGSTPDRLQTGSDRLRPAPKLFCFAQNFVQGEEGEEGAVAAAGAGGDRGEHLQAGNHRASLV